MTIAMHSTGPVTKPRCGRERQSTTSFDCARNAAATTAVRSTGWATRACRCGRERPSTTSLIAFVSLFFLFFIARMLSLLSTASTEHGYETALSLPVKEWINQGLVETTARPLPQLCRYEGHCPVGYTCVVQEESNQGGVCEPYMLDNAPQMEGTHLCIQACMDELKWEDNYQFGRRPEPLTYYSATGTGRPDGCWIHYQRVDQAPHEVIEEKVYREWLKMRSAHRIVRVDPIYGKDGNVTWSALCFNPCQNDEDCGQGFVCDLKNDSNTCRRDESYWTPTEAQKHDMVLVSGANSRYFGALKNLAASLCYWAPQHKLVVYNLGLTPREMEEIRSWSNLLDLKWADDQLKTYPPHVHVGKKYAWKPIAINESLHEYKSIFWMDAGSTFTGPIDPVIHITHQTGIFLVKGQDHNMIAGRSHPKTFEWFNHSKATFQAGPHYAGGIQAHVFPSRYVDTIVKKGATCAMDPNCIAPAGSNLRNHRYDQTVLSILAYEPDVQVPHHTEYVAAAANQLASSHTDPSFMLIYTARGSEKRYREMGICNISNVM